MSVDNFFKVIERRTEQDLYRASFRAVAQTQKDLLEQIEANRKAAQRKMIAMEVLWFFIAAVLGLLIGYIANEALSALAPQLRQQLAGFWFKKDINVFYFLCVLAFLGVYIVRLTIWALRML